MIKNITARIGALLALTAVLLLGMAPVAQAASVPAPAMSAAAQIQTAPVHTQAVSIPAETINLCASSGAASSKLLPVNRWQGATNELHSRLEGGLDVGSFMGTIHRDFIVGSAMSFGNFLWSQGANMAEFSIGFCMLDKLGGTVDLMAATIGDMLIFGAGQPILAAILVAVIFVTVREGMKTGVIRWSNLVQKAVVVGMLIVMSLGSMASSGGGIDGSTAPYKPGVGSPGWIVTTMNSTVASLASAPAMALSVAQPSTENNPWMDHRLKCDSYVAGLHRSYTEQYGEGTAALSAGIPMVISSMWERSGLTAWRQAQFGASNSADDLSDRAWCRLLEWNAGTRADSVNQALQAAMPGEWSEVSAKSIKEDKAFFPVTTEEKDRSLIAWTACTLKNDATDPYNVESWHVKVTYEKSEENPNLKDGQNHGYTAGDCLDWFSEGDSDLKAFDWPTNTKDVAERAVNDNLETFVLTLHGNKNGDGTIASFAFIIGSLTAFVVFAGVSLAVLLAKILQVLMIIALLFAGIMILLPRGTFAKLADAFKALLGTTLFIFGMQLIFAILSQITNLIQLAGSSLMGGDSTWGVLWTGISPLIAVVVMNMLFTKVLKLPSPFKISAGIAWAGAVGAGGAAAMGGVASMLDRRGAGVRRRAMSSASGATRRKLNGGLSAVTGGRLGNGAAMAGRTQTGDVRQGKGTKGAKGQDTKSALEASAASMPNANGPTSEKDQSGTLATDAAAAGTVETEGTTEENQVPAPEPLTEDEFLEQSAQDFAIPMGKERKANKRTIAMQRKVHRQAQRRDAREDRRIDNRAADEAASGKDGNNKGKIDPLIVAYSGVANSQLASGKMTRAERQQLQKAKADELDAAKASAKRGREEMGFSGAKPGTVRGKAVQGISNALHSAKEDKIGTAKKIAKGAVVGTGVVAATAVVPWAVPAAAAYYASKGGIRVAQKNTKAARNAKNDEMVSVYRQKLKTEHAETVRMQQEAARDEARQARKVAPEAGKSASPAGESAGAPQPGSQRRTRVTPDSGDGRQRPRVTADSGEGQRRPRVTT